MNWISLYILLCGLGFVSSPLWMAVVKWAQPQEFGVYDVPPVQEREYDGPPKLARQSDDWQCGECGHDKYINASLVLPPVTRRKCVRCGAVHEKRFDEGLSPLGEWIPVEGNGDGPPRLTGQIITESEATRKRRESKPLRNAQKNAKALGVSAEEASRNFAKAVHEAAKEAQ